MRRSSRWYSFSVMRGLGSPTAVAGTAAACDAFPAFGPPAFDFSSFAITDSFLSRPYTARWGVTAAIVR